jgi:hypothetical protein
MAGLGLVWALAPFFDVRAFGQCESAHLTALPPQEGDVFGFSVSMSENRAVIGADRFEALGDGAAFVYRFDAGDWGLEETLRPADQGPFDYFGRAVSVHQDVVLVGRPGDDVVPENSGSAYVFRYVKTAWAQEQKLTAFDGDSGDAFGSSVAVWGDTCVVGAPGDDDGGNTAGSAYVFVFDGSQWQEAQKLIAFDAAAGDGFGTSVAIRKTVIAVGTPGDDDDASTNSGAVYLYRRYGALWSFEHKLSAWEPAEGGNFGMALALGDETLVVGQPGYEASAASAGAAFVYRYLGVWAPEQKLTPSDSNIGDHFGSSVAVDTSVVVGSPADDDACPGDPLCDSGSAYEFRFNGMDWIQTQKIVAVDAGIGDRFGSSVAVAGLLALIGAPYTDGACPLDILCDSGSAYVFPVGGEPGIHPQTLDVHVELSPIVQNLPIERCICFELFESCSPLVVRETCATLTFGTPGEFAGHVRTKVPIQPGNYVCITARDRQHSLRSADVPQVNCDQLQYAADFSGDPTIGGNRLQQGNLNRDSVIDIVDFGVFLAQLDQNANPGRDKLCEDNAGQGYTHADLNGDGYVDVADFTFIQINFLQTDTDLCCPGRASGPPPGRTRLTRDDMKKLGLAHLTVADLNRDGVLDTADVALFLQGTRPGRR